MPNNTLVDLTKIYATSVGTGTIVLGAAVPSFRGIEGLTDGATYPYSIRQNANYEVGTGVYDQTTGTISRNVIYSSNGNAPLDLLSNAEIVFTALSTDYGQTGLSAYEIAVDHGFVGTEAEWVASLRVYATLNVPYPTYAALLTQLGMAANDRATVIPADSGTHAKVTGDIGLDGNPVPDGGQTPNSGLYQYSDNYGWVRIGNTADQDAEIAATAAAGSAGAAATSAASALESATAAGYASIVGGSCKFHDYNGQFYGAGGAITQPTTNFGTWFGSDGGLIVELEIPQERMHDNRMVRFFGNTTNQSSGNNIMAYFDGYAHSNVAQRGCFYMFAQSTTFANVSAPVPRTTTRVILARYRVGNLMHYDFLDVDTGTQYLGTAVDCTGHAGLSTFATGQVMIGDCLPAPTRTSWSIGDSAWTGGIGRIMYVNGTITLANLESLRQGADPITVFGGANLRFYRKLNEQVSSLSKITGATGDTTVAGSFTGKVYKGSNIIAPGAISVEKDLEGLVYGCVPGATTAVVRQSGRVTRTLTARGTVDIRWLSASREIERWTSVATVYAGGVYGTTITTPGTGGTTGTYTLTITGGGGSGATGTFVVSGGGVASISISNPGSGYTSAPTLGFAAAPGLTGAVVTALIDPISTTWTGEIIIPANTEWNCKQVRIRELAGSEFFDASNIGIGCAAPALGQSEWNTAFTRTGLRYQYTGQAPSSVAQTVTVGGVKGQRIRRMGLGNFLGDGIEAATQQFMKLSPRGGLMWIADGVPGSSMLQWIDDSESGRLWSDTADIITFCRRQVSTGVFPWFTAMRTQNIDIGPLVFDPTFKGKGGAQRYDHHVYEDGFFPATASIVLFPGKRENDVPGSIAYDGDGITGLTREGIRNWVAANPNLAVLGPELVLPLVDEYHPANTMTGDVWFGYSVGWGAAIGMRWCDYVDSYVDPDSFKYVAGSSNTQFEFSIISSRNRPIRNAKGSTYNSGADKKVGGIEVSADMGATWNYQVLSAEIVDRFKIRVTKLSGPAWPDFMPVHVNKGGPMGYGILNPDANDQATNYWIADGDERHLNGVGNPIRLTDTVYTVQPA